MLLNMMSVDLTTIWHQAIKSGIKHMCNIESVIFQTAALVTTEPPEERGATSGQLCSFCVPLKWTHASAVSAVVIFVATPSSVSQTNKWSLTVTSQRVKVPHKDRDVRQDFSRAEEDVGAADSSPAAGGRSWHSPCTHWQAETFWGAFTHRFSQTVANCWKVSVPLSSFQILTLPQTR